MKRFETKKIKIGNITIGGSSRVLIQSMCNIKTEKIDLVVKQINKCTKLGADLMRVSVLDAKDAKAIKEIKKHITIPLVADIHFDYKLALLSIKNGADAIRINPGNIGKDEYLKEIVSLAKQYNTVIRIGVNVGSLEKEFKDNTDYKNLLTSAKKTVNKIEKLGFKNIVLSLKSDNVIDTYYIYKEASNMFSYPLHLGITEAGPSEIGIIRSVAALSPLLIDGIGDTIRISLSDEPEKEVITAKRLLHDLGLYDNYHTLISCPTCGRTMVNLIPLANKVQKYLETHHINKKIAVMGCIVNGPGEAKNADFGLAGGNKVFALFKKGVVIRTVKEEDAFSELIKEIKKLN